MRSSNIIVSNPSAVKSLTNVLLIVPKLLTILIVPELVPSVKSAPIVVPEFVQYNVPVPKLEVVIL